MAYGAASFYMDSMKITTKEATKRRINMEKVGAREGGKSPCEEGLFQTKG